MLWQHPDILMRGRLKASEEMMKNSPGDKKELRPEWHFHQAKNPSRCVQQRGRAGAGPAVVFVCFSRTCDLCLSYSGHLLRLASVPSRQRLAVGKHYL
jgi:hypothetical protein